MTIAYTNDRIRITGTETGDSLRTSIAGRAELAAAIGTGTISSSGTTVTGVGTAFNTFFRVNDRIIAGGQIRRITAIASDTSLTTASAFSPVIAAGASFARAASVEIRDRDIIFTGRFLEVGDGTTTTTLTDQDASYTFDNISGNVDPPSVTFAGARFQQRASATSTLTNVRINEIGRGKGHTDSRIEGTLNWTNVAYLISVNTSGDRTDFYRNTAITFNFDNVTLDGTAVSGALNFLHLYGSAGTQSVINSTRLEVPGGVIAEHLTLNDCVCPANFADFYIDRGANQFNRLSWLNTTWNIRRRANNATVVFRDPIKPGGWVGYDSQGQANAIQAVTEVRTHNVRVLNDQGAAQNGVNCAVVNTILADANAVVYNVTTDAQGRIVEQDVPVFVGTEGTSGFAYSKFNFAVFSYALRTRFETRAFSTTQVGRINEDVVQLTDSEITEATVATVDAYTTLETAARLYDRSKSFYVSNWNSIRAPLLITKNGTTVSMRSSDIMTFNEAAASAYARVDQSSAGAGTISQAVGSSAVVGVGTSFTTFFSVGDKMQVAGEERRVVTITDNLNLTLDGEFAEGGTTAGTSYNRIRNSHTIDPGALFTGSIAGGESLTLLDTTTDIDGTISVPSLILPAHTSAKTYNLGTLAGTTITIPNGNTADLTFTKAVTAILYNGTNTFNINHVGAAPTLSGTGAGNITLLTAGTTVSITNLPTADTPGYGIYNRVTSANLTGTIQVAQGATAMIGVGTAFTTELAVDDFVLAGGQALQVESITDNTNVVLRSAAATAINPGTNFQRRRLSVLVAFTSVTGSTANHQIPAATTGEVWVIAHRRGSVPLRQQITLNPGNTVTVDASILNTRKLKPEGGEQVTVTADTNLSVTFVGQTTARINVANALVTGQNIINTVETTLTSDGGLRWILERNSGVDFANYLGQTLFFGTGWRLRRLATTDVNAATFTFIVGADNGVVVENNGGGVSHNGVVTTGGSSGGSSGGDARVYYDSAAGAGGTGTATAPFNNLAAAIAAAKASAARTLVCASNFGAASTDYTGLTVVGSGQNIQITNPDTAVVTNATFVNMDINGTLSQTVPWRVIDCFLNGVQGNVDATNCRISAVFEPHGNCKFRNCYTLPGTTLGLSCSFMLAGEIVELENFQSPLEIQFLINATARINVVTDHDVTINANSTAGIVEITIPAASMVTDNSTQITPTINAPSVAPTAAAVATAVQSNLERANGPLSDLFRSTVTAKPGFDIFSGGTAGTTSWPTSGLTAGRYNGYTAALYDASLQQTFFARVTTNTATQVNIDPATPWPAVPATGDILYLIAPNATINGATVAAIRADLERTDGFLYDLVNSNIATKINPTGGGAGTNTINVTSGELGPANFYQGNLFIVRDSTTTNLREVGVIASHTLTAITTVDPFGYDLSGGSDQLFVLPHIRGETAAAISAAWGAATLEGTLTREQALRVILADASGDIVQALNGNYEVKAQDGTTNRIVGEPTANNGRNVTTVNGG